MNIKASGKIPEILKRLAAITAAVLLTACKPDPPCESENNSVISSQADDSTHVPVEDNSSGCDYNTSENNSSDSASRDLSSDDSSFSRESSESSSLSPPDSEISGGSSSTDSAPDSVPESSATSEVESSGSEPISQPPPVVVIPNLEIPTSPGIKCYTSDRGIIDYSNAERGYISAKYTGSAKLKLRIRSGGKTYDHDLAAGGVTEYYPLSFGSGDYTVTIYENISGISYAEALTGSFSVNLDNELLPFLQPNRYSDYNSGSECVAKSAEVCAGKTGTIDKIAAVFGWISDNITYDYELAATVKSGSGYVPNPDRTFNSRKGICFDYSSLMCAMLRSQGIPTRLVVGYAAPDIRHAWNEIYTEETGWITPELLLKNSGYNIADSTFYASANDKSQIAAYISNPANYQEQYYY